MQSFENFAFCTQRKNTESFYFNGLTTNHHKEEKKGDDNIEQTPKR